MNKKNPVVAIVENDAALLKALERLLRAHAYKAELYTSAEAYLARGDAQAPACLILDISLGGISGLDLQKRLAGEGNAPPIIFITAETNPLIRAHALRMGCMAYLTKPFDAAHLVGSLAKALPAAQATSTIISQREKS